MKDSEVEGITGPCQCDKSCKEKKWKNSIGFWVLGLCNNYAYVIMLSAAFDLLKDKENSQTNQSNITNSTDDGCVSKCNPISTGAILLADILPSLAIKLIAPFITIGFNYRILTAVFLSSMSFILTSFTVAHWMTFIGVICAALSSGLGEVTLLSFSSYYHKDVVSAWSSGTGGAGVFGALSYAVLVYWMSVRDSLLLMLLVPVIMACTFWCVIDLPVGIKPKCPPCRHELKPMLRDSVDLSKKHIKQKEIYSLKQKMTLVKPLLKYMIPLGLVYFAEYFINQGLMELLYFKNVCSWLSHDNQYRWYQVDYQVGVMISRSSVKVFQIKRLWVLPVLQFINLIFLLCEAYYQFLGSIWIVLAMIFYEGLLGGFAYVNTFYRISQEVEEKHKEFSMGVASLGDASGITLAGITAVQVHDALCKMRL